MAAAVRVCGCGRLPKARQLKPSTLVCGLVKWGVSCVKKGGTSPWPLASQFVVYRSTALHITPSPASCSHTCMCKDDYHSSGAGTDCCRGPKARQAPWLVHGRPARSHLTSQVASLTAPWTYGLLRIGRCQFRAHPALRGCKDLPLWTGASNACRSHN